MKFFLLSILFISSLSLKAQNDKVTALPPGTYAVQGNNETAWAHGDIVLIDDSHYKTGSENAGGEYKFSVTAQRILFVSGPLKGAFAKTAVTAGIPAIILPLKENKEVGFKLEMDVWAHYKKN
ncbi:MAG TPA: hypothetical protein VM888_10200 [Chitinophagaceae bacterium]|nr:hypothetical protein [Chitinophagaceae bacterium]